MARLVLCVLALCAGAYAVPTSSYEKLDSKVLQERQQELLVLFRHIHEPVNAPKCVEIASKWSIEHNLEHYSNITAAKMYAEMLEHGWYLPRAVPFSVDEPNHSYEAMTLFYVFYSAKDYDTFYKTAVYLRDIVNEYLYVYTLSIAIIYRHDTQGVAIPAIYEIFPSYFNNGEVMVTAQRINTHGRNHVKYYPSTYVWDENVIIKWNETIWPYFDNDQAMGYFTHDYSLNALYYNIHLLYPKWLGSDIVPGLVHDRRGEIWWFRHRQLLARYYMERLSNGLGEIPEISNVVEDGYVSGLLYHNGIPYPSRPNYYSLEQPNLVEDVEILLEYERRIWEAVEKGFIVNQHGEHVNILTHEGLDILGRLVESNADSPNSMFYKDFVKVWKQVLGNSVQPHHHHHNQLVPLVLPSAIENYQTALRDPAFYMMWKRILKLFVRWQKNMPLYKPEELAYKPVSIKKVEVDKLLTYFEQSYMNITQHLHQNTAEVQGQYDDVSVFVQYPRLNHKPFSVRVHVKSDVAKTVVVKFFLAPKYDGKGYEIPLHENYENWFLFDHFTYDLTVGDCVITRESVANAYTVKEWPNAHEIYEKALKGQWMPDVVPSIEKFPHHLLLPKGKVGGMPFQFVVYIQEYRAPKVPYGTGFDPKVSLGLGTGARFVMDQPLAFPVDRPLYNWQVKDVKNLYIQDIVINHKHAPEIVVPYVSSPAGISV